MKGIKLLIIKLLGGLTKLEHLEKMEEFRERCEEFAEENLISKEFHTMLHGESFRFKQFQKPVVIIGSSATISDCKVNAIHVAPWASNTYLSNNIYENPELLK